MNFCDWLISQVGRNGAIGELARIVREDQRAMSSDDLLAYLQDHLRERRASVWRTWREYREFKERERFTLVNIREEALEKD